MHVPPPEQRSDPVARDTDNAPFLAGPFLLHAAAVLVEARKRTRASR